MRGPERLNFTVRGSETRNRERRERIGVVRHGDSGRREGGRVGGG